MTTEVSVDSFLGFNAFYLFFFFGFNAFYNGWNGQDAALKWEGKITIYINLLPFNSFY